MAAQDQVTLISGATVDGKVTTVSDSIVSYTVQKKSKVKERSMDAYRVFSIRYADGSNVIVYEQDTATGNYFSQDEMQLFVFGEQDARKNYRGGKMFALGALYGIAGGLALPESFLVVLVPASATILAMVPRVKIKPSMARNSALLSEPAYVMGFERTARGKKIQNVLKGSVVGTILAVAGWNIANSGN